MSKSLNTKAASVPRESSDIEIPEQLIESGLIEIKLKEFRQNKIFFNILFSKALNEFVFRCRKLPKSKQSENKEMLSKLKIFLGRPNKTLVLDKLGMRDINSLIGYVVSMCTQNRINDADYTLASSAQAMLEILLKKIEEEEEIKGEVTPENKARLIGTLLSIVTAYNPLKQTVIEDYMEGLTKYAWMWFDADANATSLLNIVGLCQGVSDSLSSLDAQRYFNYVNELKEHLDKANKSLSRLKCENEKERCRPFIEHFEESLKPYKKWVDLYNLKQTTTITKTMRVLKKFENPNFDDLLTMVGICYGISNALNDKTKNKKQRLGHILKLKKYVDKIKNSLSQLDYTEDQKKVYELLIKHLEESLEPHKKWADSYKPEKTITEIYIEALEEFNTPENFTDLSVMIALCQNASTVLSKDKKGWKYIQSANELKGYVNKTKNSLSQLECTEDTQDQRKVCELSIKHLEESLNQAKDYNRLNKEKWEEVKKPSSSFSPLFSRLFTYIIKSLKFERCVPIR